MKSSDLMADQPFSIVRALDETHYDDTDMGGYRYGEGALRVV